MSNETRWPALPLDEWRDTNETLHRWTQIVGKISLALTPRVNHWWNVSLSVTPRGLATPLLPYGDRSFDMEFDFGEHVLRIRTTGRGERAIPLGPRSVAALYREIFAALDSLGIRCRIWTTPVEIDDPIPLDRDEKHRSYERDPVERFQKILARTHALFTEFRAGFIGKCSPVQFFWGSFDLAVTRFSGRPAPPREGADSITKEAYFHEASSVGFWPGDGRLTLPAFYSYAAPEPPGFRDARIEPRSAYYHPELAGFYLHYDAMRASPDPEAALMEFCRSTYDAAASAGQWDRTALERR